MSSEPPNLALVSEVASLKAEQLEIKNTVNNLVSMVNSLMRMVAENSQ